MSRPYYEQPDLWNSPPQPFQQKVRADILRLIPKDVRSLLDVGCGNGFITNAFLATFSYRNRQQPQCRSTH